MKPTTVVTVGMGCAGLLTGSAIPAAVQEMPRPKQRSIVRRPYVLIVLSIAPPEVIR